LAPLLLTLILAGQPAPPAEVAGDPPTRVLPAGRGPAVVLVSDPGTPWAVVQLHVRTVALTRDQRGLHGALPLADALAQGESSFQRTSASARVLARGGEVRTWVDDDELVVSDGLPAAELADALRAMDQRLATRRQLTPATRGWEALNGPARLPYAVAQLLAPAPGPPPTRAFGDAAYGHLPSVPPRYPRPSREATAAELRPLAQELLTRDNVVVVVVGAEDLAGLERLARRHLRTPLPAKEVERAPVVPPDGERIVAAPRALPPARGPHSWLWIATPGMRFLADQERRGYAIAARMLGGEAGFSEGHGWVSLHVPLTDPALAAEAETTALARIAQLAEDANAAAVADAAAALRGERWRAVTEPSQLALATGREMLLRGAPSLSVASYEGTSADDVKAAARALLAAPRVVLRHAASLGSK
jgi:hypothetical protein